MRHTTRTMLIALVVAFNCQVAMAQESGLRWWPFGKKHEAAPQSTTVVTAPLATPSPPALPPSEAITPVESFATVPQNAAPPTAALQPPTAGQIDRPPIIESPFANLNWPKVPELSLPKPRLPQMWPNESEVDETRNAWAGRSPDAARPSPLQAVRSGVHRVGDSTRAAWRKTVDTLSPGENTAVAASPRVASREAKPPIWKRMFGAEEPPVAEGPRTITEWMAQDRLGP